MMLWIKQKGPGVLPGYRCGGCGSLWVTVDKDASPPEECKACGRSGKPLLAEQTGAGGEG